VLGGVIGDRNQAALRQRETAVFGETERGSAITVRIIDHPDSNNVMELEQPGIGYLWFSMRRRNAPNRQALAASTACRIELHQRGANNAMLHHAAESLWLVTQLGSLGARSRRGAGSLRIKQVIEGWPEGVPTPLMQAQTPTELQIVLATGLRQIRQSISLWANAVPPASLADTEFDVLHPDACRVWVLDESFDRWQDALEAVGIAMQAFRVRFPRNDFQDVPDDYANVKSALQGGELRQPVQRAAFGLPIVFYFTSLRGQRGTLEGNDHDRRSSPLIIRVSQLASGKFVIVLTVFYAKLLPDGERLKLRRQGPPAWVSTPDWTAVDLFLTYIDSAVAPRLEVNFR
jgi:CRISPR-associated protein Cmr1